MNIRIQASFLAFALLLASCSSNTSETGVSSEPETLINVCKSTIAGAVTANSHNEMMGSHTGDVSDVSYYRDDDGKLFKYQCKYYPTSATTGAVVWRGVDVWGPGSGPGVWREREYDRIVNYRAKKDTTNGDSVILEIIETGANKVPTGERRVEEFQFKSASHEKP